jgi:putative ABC transport system permease protein
MLGETWRQASIEFRRDAMRAGLMPTINSMTAAGIVFLPGMMTGQILAGTSPTIAVKYHILIMFTIAAGTGFGTFSRLRYVRSVCLMIVSGCTLNV